MKSKYLKTISYIFLLLLTVFISGCTEETIAIGVIIVLASLAFVGFVIYFIFKLLEFVVRAINLYKSIIDREDIIIRRQEQILRVLLETKDDKTYTNEMVKSYFKDMDLNANWQKR